MLDVLLAVYKNLTFAQDAHGIVWAYSYDSPDPLAPTVGGVSRPILAPGHEFHNLFAASALLYAVNRDTLTFIEKFIEQIEVKGLDEMATHFQQIASTLNTAARVAEEGLSVLS